MADIIRELEKEQLRTDLPKLEVGDTVRVFVKVIEVCLLRQTTQ